MVNLPRSGEPSGTRIREPSLTRFGTLFRDAAAGACARSTDGLAINRYAPIPAPAASTTSSTTTPRRTRLRLDVSCRLSDVSNCVVLGISNKQIVPRRWLSSAAAMVSSRASNRRPLSAAADQAEGGARARKRKCGDATGIIRVFAANRTRVATAGIGNAGAAAGLTELANAMTAQMTQ